MSLQWVQELLGMDLGSRHTQPPPPRWCTIKKQETLQPTKGFNATKESFMQKALRTAKKYLIFIELTYLAVKASSRVGRGSRNKTYKT